MTEPREVILLKLPERANAKKVDAIRQVVLEAFPDSPVLVMGAVGIEVLRAESQGRLERIEAMLQTLLERVPVFEPQVPITAKDLVL